MLAQKHYSSFLPSNNLRPAAELLIGNDRSLCFSNTLNGHFSLLSYLSCFFYLIGVKIVGAWVRFQLLPRFFVLFNRINYFYTDIGLKVIPQLKCKTPITFDNAKSWAARIHNLRSYTASTQNSSNHNWSGISPTIPLPINYNNYTNNQPK